jgi:hypothetical protein
MAVPCNRPYARNPLDRQYVASELGLDEHDVSDRLHTIKRLAGLKGHDSVVICLDDGEVYDLLTEDALGNLCDP